MPRYSERGIFVRAGMFAIGCAIAISGCATSRSPLQTPILVVGVVERPTWTGWVFNHCEYAQPVPMEVRSAQQCLAHGGELHDAWLINPREVGGRWLGGNLRIAFPGHGYVYEYRERHFLVLQPSTADFLEATGIGYIATEWGNYDAKQRCLDERGWGHVDQRFCPDRQFHQDYRGQCLPVAQFLEHYAPQTLAESTSLGDVELATPGMEAQPAER